MKNYITTFLLDNDALSIRVACKQLSPPTGILQGHQAETQKIIGSGPDLSGQPQQFHRQLLETKMNFLHQIKGISKPP